MGDGRLPPWPFPWESCGSEGLGRAGLPVSGWAKHPIQGLERVRSQLGLSRNSLGVSTLPLAGRVDILLLAGTQE